MKYTVTNQQDLTIIHVVGRLDSTTSPQFESGIQEYLAPPQKDLIMDFSELDYISSAGLRVILKIAKAFSGVSADFSVCGMLDNVYEVFEISGFDNYISIYDSLAEYGGGRKK